MLSCVLCYGQNWEGKQMLNVTICSHPHLPSEFLCFLPCSPATFTFLLFQALQAAHFALTSAWCMLQPRCFLLAGAAVCTEDLQLLLHQRVHPGGHHEDCCSGLPALHPWPLEPTGYSHCHPLHRGYCPGGDEDQCHPYQPHHHPRHEGTPHCKRSVIKVHWIQSILSLPLSLSLHSIPLSLLLLLSHPPPPAPHLSLTSLWGNPVQLTGCYNI